MKRLLSMVVSAVFFLSMLLLGRPDTTSAEPHPNANLVNVVATFNTTNDNKDDDTAVWVEVFNNGQMIARCADWGNKEYKDWDKDILVCNDGIVPIEYKDANNLNVKITSEATGTLGFFDGNDKWKFYADVVLTFSDGTRIGLRSPNEIILNSRDGDRVTSTEQFIRYNPDTAREEARRRTGR